MLLLVLLSATCLASNNTTRRASIPKVEIVRWCESSTEMAKLHDKCDDGGFVEHTFDTCKTYAKLRKKWAGIEKWNHKPAGCVINKDGKIYFNARERPSDVNDKQFRRLCCGHIEIPKPAGYEEPMKGFCENHNEDQNDGMKFLQRVHGDDQAERERCYTACKNSKHERITGCELVWGSDRRGCYVHTQPVTDGSFRSSDPNRGWNCLCWLMGKFSPGDEVVTKPGCEETLYGKGGRFYSGCQTKTRSGRTCQKWTSQKPHKHDRWSRLSSEWRSVLGIGPHNMCRNPDGEHTIWCYTTDSGERWEYCDPVTPQNNPDRD